MRVFTVSLNATRTEFMLIGSSQRFSVLSDTLVLSIDNFPIEQVSCVKSLGGYIDEDLTWHFHFDHYLSLLSAWRMGPLILLLQATLSLATSSPFLHVLNPRCSSLCLLIYAMSLDRPLLRLPSAPPGGGGEYSL